MRSYLTLVAIWTIICITALYVLLVWGAQR